MWSTGTMIYLLVLFVCGVGVGVVVVVAVHSAHPGMLPGEA